MKNQSQQTLRNQILTESVQILGTHGFDGLSLREVAKKLKVTHQAPYHYFPDKSALLIELKKMGFQLLNESMSEVSRKMTEQNLNPHLILEEIGLKYFDFCLQNPGYFRAMFAATSSGEGIRVPEAQESFGCLMKAVENLQASGWMKNENSSEIIAMICWTYMHGLVSLALEKYPMIGGKYEPRDLAKKMISQMSLLLKR
jgi:AcrR family transcriptional regulator